MKNVPRKSRIPRPIFHEVILGGQPFDLFHVVDKICKCWLKFSVMFENFLNFNSCTLLSQCQKVSHIYCIIFKFVWVLLVIGLGFQKPETQLFLPEGPPLSSKSSMKSVFLFWSLHIVFHHIRSTNGNLWSFCPDSVLAAL